jgi:hypothetical protein
MTLVEKDSVMQRSKVIRVSHLAFPNGLDLPAELLQLPRLAGISKLIVANLAAPERGIGLGFHSAMAAGVPMPEAAVDEYDGSEASQHDIRCPWERLDVKPVTKASGKEVASDGEFRLCARTPDALHEGVARRRGRVGSQSIEAIDERA